MADAGQDRLTAPAELLEALRASGAAGREPVRFRFLEALARRAEGHTGEARRLLDDKLARAATALGERCTRPQTAGRVTGTVPAPASPLAELLAHIRNHALPETASHPQHALADAAPRGELKSVAYFQRTWSQMSVDQQLAQALAQVPDNAGPFNPQRLAVQALQRMRDTAPDYLRQMLIYMDGLIWLEQAAGTARPVAAEKDKKKAPTRKAKGS